MNRGGERKRKFPVIFHFKERHLNVFIFRVGEKIKNKIESRFLLKSKKKNARF